MTIDLNNIPVEPTITILNPDGTELITTNNITTLYYIRLQIKQQKLKGYKIRTYENHIIMIKPNGELNYKEALPKDICGYHWREVPGAILNQLSFKLCE